MATDSVTLHFPEAFPSKECEVFTKSKEVIDPRGDTVLIELSAVIYI